MTLYNSFVVKILFFLIFIFALDIPLNSEFDVLYVILLVFLILFSSLNDKIKITVKIIETSMTIDKIL